MKVELTDLNKLVKNILTSTYYSEKQAERTGKVEIEDKIYKQLFSRNDQEI